jgi:predicted PurR-regulated permease PerM
MTRRIEISSKTIVFTVVFLLSLKLIWIIRELIYALFLAFIFMSALKPLVNKLERFKLPRAIASFLVVLSTLVGFGFILAFMIPPIITETVTFMTNLPVFLIETFPFLSSYLSAESALQFLPDITQNALRLVGGVFTNFLFIISVVFFTFYFLLEERFIGSFLSRFLEAKDSKKIEKILRKAENRMGAWMRGELILMTIIGVTTYIGLSFMQVPFALSLAFFAGLLEIIPIIGPIISAVPAFIVASSTSFLLGGGTLLLYLIIQQLENNVIVPYVMNKAVGIHPITTLIALSIGGKLGGILGAILAVPVALVIETIVKDLAKDG